MPDHDADGMKIAASPSSMVTFAATVMLTRWPTTKRSVLNSVVQLPAATSGYER